MKKGRGIGTLHAECGQGQCGSVLCPWRLRRGWLRPGWLTEGLKGRLGLGHDELPMESIRLSEHSMLPICTLRRAE